MEKNPLFFTLLDHIFSSVMYWLQFVGGIYMIWLAGHMIRMIEEKYKNNRPSYQNMSGYF